MGQVARSRSCHRTTTPASVTLTSLSTKVYLTTTTLVAANWYLIPVMPSGYDMKGLEQLISTTMKIRKKYNPGLNLLGVLLGDTNMRTVFHRSVYDTLADYFGSKMFKTTISTSVRQQETTVRGRSVLETAVDENSAQEFRSLARELTERLHEAERQQREPDEHVKVEVNR